MTATETKSCIESLAPRKIRALLKQRATSHAVRNEIRAWIRWLRAMKYVKG